MQEVLNICCSMDSEEELVSKPLLSLVSVSAPSSSLTLDFI
jgi:hypothetical protein